jgi:hypothetical protein
MGWETRKGKEFFYHTSTTGVTGRRKRTYLGRRGDPVAELAATHVDLDRVNRELDRRARDRADAALRGARHAAGLEVASAWLADALGQAVVDQVARLEDVQGPAGRDPGPRVPGPGGPARVPDPVGGRGDDPAGPRAGDQGGLGRAVPGAVE